MIIIVIVLAEVGMLIDAVKRVVMSSLLKPMLGRFVGFVRVGGFSVRLPRNTVFLDSMFLGSVEVSAGSIFEIST